MTVVSRLTSFTECLVPTAKPRASSSVAMENRIRGKGAGMAAMHRGSTERAGDRRSPDFRHYSLSLIAESLSRSRQNSRSASSMATSSSPKHGVSSTGNIRLKLLPSTSRSRWVSSPTATIRSEAKVFPGLDIAVANVQRRRRCQSFHREPCTRRSKSIPRWSASAEGWPPAPGLSSGKRHHFREVQLSGPCPLREMP